MQAENSRQNRQVGEGQGDPPSDLCLSATEGELQGLPQRLSAFIWDLGAWDSDVGTVMRREAGCPSSCQSASNSPVSRMLSCPPLLQGPYD